MKIIFIFCNEEESPLIFPLGIGILSSVLKNEGHTVNSIYVPVGKDDKIDYNRIITKIKEFNPDLICYSAISATFTHITNIAKCIRRIFHTTTLCGGVHPTLYPEETLNVDAIDYICVGDGEKTVKEFVEKLENHERLDNIPGIWSLNSDETLRKNKLYPLQDLNESPAVDYDAFGREFIIELLNRSNKWLRYITSRGCPYNCSYCHNKMLREIYSEEIGVPISKLNYIRFKDVDICISEIANIVNTYGVEVINFMDDLFCLDKKRTLDFCNKFKTEFMGRVGYSTQTHILHLDKEIIEALRESNCLRVVIGVESATERILKIFNRRTPISLMNENLQMLVEAKFPLGTWTLNILGNPTETQKEMETTLKFNATHLVDVCKFNFMAPYKDSAIYTYCQEHNLLVDGYESQYFQTRRISVINHQEREMAFLEKFWDIGHWYMNIYDPINLGDYFQPLIKEVETIKFGDWDSKKSDFFEKDREILKELAINNKMHYAFRFLGKTSGKVIGLWNPEKH